MANTLYLKDGTTEICFDSGFDGSEYNNELIDFFERLLYEKLGKDAADMFNSIIENIKEAAEYKAENRDELVSDGYLQMCRDAMNTFEQMIKELDKPRISRLKLRELALSGYNDIYKNT